jgi:hypothetical protein
MVEINMGEQEIYQEKRGDTLGKPGKRAFS